MHAAQQRAGGFSQVTQAQVGRSLHGRLQLPKAPVFKLRRCFESRISAPSMTMQSLDIGVLMMQQQHGLGGRGGGSHTPIAFPAFAATPGGPSGGGGARSEDFDGVADSGSDIDADSGSWSSGD